MLIPIWCLLHHVTAVACKDPGHSAKSADGRLHLLMHTLLIQQSQTSEWADNAAVQASCWNLSGNELTHNLSGNIHPQLSQLTEPLWTDPGIKSGITVHKLISTLIKCGRGMNGGKFS